MKKRKREFCSCGIPLNEKWHLANNWASRQILASMSMNPYYNKDNPFYKGEFIPRTAESCNACHCPHSDCDFHSCEEYHKNKLSKEEL